MRQPAVSSPARLLPRRLGGAASWPPAGQVLVNVALAVLCLVVLLPVLWAVSASLKGPDELYQAVPSLWVRNPSLANYQYMLTRMANVPLYMRNSFVVTGGTVLVVCVTASLAGYAFARLEFRGRDLIFTLLLLSVFIPQSGGLMALYELMSFLKLRNNLVGLILLFSSSLTVPVFVMRQTFLNLPRELEESARIDGATWWEVFWHIAFPMATSGLVVVAIVTFVRVWGDFLVTLTMVDRDVMNTIAIGVRRTATTGGTAFFADTSFVGRFATYGADAALYLMAIAPVVLIWVLLQRWFVRGLSEGVLKL
jgi:ABC-type glycerol-3-phosphate transport system permease component